MANLSPGQFSLRSVLILVTAAAGLSALGTWLGARTLIPLLGVFVALANYLGMLAVVQRPRIAQVAMYFAFVAFVTSFFLPAYGVFQNQNLSSYMLMPGWRACLTAFWAWPQSLLRPSSSPRTLQNVVEIVALAPALMIVIADNLAMLVAPALTHRAIAGEMKWYRGLLVVSVTGAWLVPTLAPSAEIPLLIGYFVWCAALSVPVIVLRITRWQLIALVLIAALFGGGWLLQEWLRWGFH